jgi:Na+-driven multidrug efflux pump
MVNQHLAGTGYPFSQLLSILVSIAVNIGANAWLLRTLGLAGAPIAVACAHGTRLVMNTAYMLRKSRQA